MLLPLQGESWGRTTIPRAPLRSALGYVLVAPSGRALNKLVSMEGRVSMLLGCIRASAIPLSCQEKPTYEGAPRNIIPDRLSLLQIAAI